MLVCTPHCSLLDGAREAAGILGNGRAWTSEIYFWDKFLFVFRHFSHFVSSPSAPITASIKNNNILCYWKITWKRTKRERRLRQLSLGKKHQL